MGPTGIRNADARSTSSCTVRSLVNAHMRGQTSSRRSIRVWKLVRSSLPIQSSAPIMEQKSCHCWPVIVQNPTHPSFAGSTDGISICRVGRKSGAKWSNIGRYVWKASIIDSYCETSICVPVPVVCDARVIASIAGALNAAATKSPSSPPHAAGSSPGMPRFSVAPVNACSMKSFAGRFAHGPVVPKCVREARTVDGEMMWMFS